MNIKKDMVLLTDEELVACVKAGYEAHEFDIDLAIDRRIAKAQALKLWGLTKGKGFYESYNEWGKVGVPHRRERLIITVASEECDAIEAIIKES